MHKIFVSNFVPIKKYQKKISNSLIYDSFIDCPYSNEFDVENDFKSSINLQC